MQAGIKVIRKADARNGVACFGIVEGLNGKKATVRWHLPQRQQHSTLALTSLLEVTPEMEQDIRAKQHARLLARQAKLDAERIYLCTNVNGEARTSNQGHPAPLPLAPGQTVNREGELCWYCKHPVVLRAAYEKEKKSHA